MHYHATFAGGKYILYKQNVCIMLWKMESIPEHSRTFVDAVQSREDDDKERRCVLSGIDKMWKCQPCVAVTSQTLRKTKP